MIRKVKEVLAELEHQLSELTLLEFEVSADCVGDLGQIFLSLLVVLGQND